MRINPPGPTFDPADLVIRPVAGSDLPALEWDGEYTKYRRMYANLHRNTKTGRTLMWMIETPQGDLVGQAFVMLSSNEREAADGISRAYVFAFRVKPEWRNLGVGTRLMHFVEADLVKRGFTYITLNVARDNPGARRLYERLGYQVTGTKPGIWSFKDHQGVIQHVEEPAWRMIKQLRKD